jgi:hypothetical protein
MVILYFLINIILTVISSVDSYKNGESTQFMWFWGVITLLFGIPAYIIAIILGVIGGIINFIKW